MAADFPGAVKTFTTKTNNIDFVEASHVNDLQDEVTAIETYVGTSSDGEVIKETATQTLTNKTLTAPVENSGQYNSPTFKDERHTKFTVTDQATVTFDWDNGNWGQVTLTDNRTVALADPKTAGYYILQFTQDGTGSRTVTWPANIKWPNGEELILSTTAAAVDLVGFIFDGTDFLNVGNSLNLS